MLKLRGPSARGRVGHIQGKVNPIAYVGLEHDEGASGLSRPDLQTVARAHRLDGACVIGVHKELPGACRVLIAYEPHAEFGFGSVSALDLLLSSSYLW